MRVKFMKEGNKGFVQRPQPAALDPALQQQQQVCGTRQRLQLGQAFGC